MMVLAANCEHFSLRQMPLLVPPVNLRTGAKVGLRGRMT